MADKRRLVSEDLYKLVFVSDPQISPDGKKIAFVRSHIDEKTKEYRSHIYLVPTDGGPARQFTSGPKADTTPRWSPDGSKLAFISDRGSERQIHVMPVSGGEAVPVTKMRYGAGGPVCRLTVPKSPSTLRWIWMISPKTTRSHLTRKPRKPGEETQGRADSRHAAPRQIRYGDGTYQPQPPEPYLRDRCRGKGPATDITPGEYDNGSPVWSPCGKSMAYINRRPDPDYEPWFADVWVVPAEGGEPRKVTKRGPFRCPGWTPDGKFIIRRAQDGAAARPLTKLWKVPAEGGEPVCLTPNFDQSLGDRCAGDSKLGGGNNGPP